MMTKSRTLILRKAWRYGYQHGCVLPPAFVAFSLATVQILSAALGSDEDFLLVALGRFA